MRNLSILLLISILFISPNLLSKTIDSESAFEIGKAYQMEGVDSAISGLVKGRVREFVRENIREMTIQSFAESKAGLNNKNTKKEEIKRRLKKKIKKELPGLVRKALYEELFLGKFGEEVKEARETIDKIVFELQKSFNERADVLIDRIYSQAIAEIDNYLEFDVGRINVNLTDIRTTLDQAIRLDTIEWTATDFFSGLIGESTALGLRRRFKDIMEGELPSEVLEYLDYGPEKFAEYVSKTKDYLPAAQFGKLKDQILHTPLFIIPNGLYGGILASSAAKHFAAAFKGAVIDPYELKRGKEVTEVMIWQLSNKEGISVDLDSMLDALKMIGDKLGVGLTDLGVIGKNVKLAKDKLEKIEAQVKEFDDYISGKIDWVDSEIKERVQKIKDELLEFQNDIFEPAIDLYEKADKKVDEAKKHLLNEIPKDFYGVPEDWEKAKKQFGINKGVFGKIGEYSPWDALQKAAEELGLKKAYEKFKKDMKRTADDINEAVSGALSNVAVNVVDAFGFTDKFGKALGIDDVPANNPSIENPLDPVLLHNGEFFYKSIDLKVPGRGIDFEFSRVYRSRADFISFVGYNWFFNYEESLVVDDKRVIHIDENGLKFEYELCVDEDGVSNDNLEAFKSPRGVFNILYKNSKGYVLRRPDGFKIYFSKSGHMVKREDRFGNSLKFLYDKFGRLKKVVDSLGRDFHFLYNKRSLLKEVRDFAGRSVLLEYDRDEDLVSVTGPKSFTYPKGKRKLYAYSTGFSKGELAHNMLRVMDPNGNIYLKMKYGESSYDFDRVISQQYGKSGKVIGIIYKFLRPAYLERFLGKGLNQNVDEVLLTDRLGIEHVYEHNANGSLLREYVVNEIGDRELLHEKKYNGEGLLAESLGRGGILNQYIYDKESPNRFAQGNIIKKISFSRGRGEKKVSEYDYEPLYNRIKYYRSPSGVTTSVFFENDETIVKVGSSDGEQEKEYRYKSNEFGEIVWRKSPEGFEYKDSYQDGRLVQDDFGNEYEYDLVGNVISKIDQLGNRYRYHVGNLNQLMSEISPEPFNYKRSFYYDKNDNISEIVFQNVGSLNRNIIGEEVSYRYTYDDLDRLVSLEKQVDKNRSIVNRWFYDAEGRLIQEVYPEGNSVKYFYNNFGDLIRLERGNEEDGHQYITFRYNNYGDLEEIEKSGGAVERIQPDSWGRPKNILMPNGSLKKIEYSLADNVKSESIIDKYGDLLSKKEYLFDGLERVVEKRSLLFLNSAKESKWVSQKFRYNENDSVTEIIDENGNRWKYKYNKYGKFLEVKDPLGNRALYNYDKVQKLTEVEFVETSGSRQKTKYRHDSLGRLVVVESPNGAQIKFNYDSFNNVVVKTNPTAFSTQFLYDGIGRLIESKAEIEKDEFSNIKYKWDGNSRLEEITDANGNSTKYAYDSLDRLSSVTYVDGLIARYGYDLAGNLVFVQKPGGEKVFNLFDSSGNIVGRRVHGDSVRGSSWQWFSYDGMGRLVTSFDNNNPSDDLDDILEFYRYDSLSRKVAESINGKWVSTRYDSLGNPIVKKYPSGKRLYTTYDPLGRVESQYFDGKEVINNTYEGAGQLVSSRFGNKLELDYKYLDSGELFVEELKGREEIYKHNYDYYKDGFLSSKSMGDETLKYAYDGMGRLIAAEDKYLWRLDKVGNWLSLIDGEEEKIFQNNTLNQIVASLNEGEVKYKYDKNGNLIHDNRHQYFYDGFGRLSSVFDLNNTLLATYSYDVHNRRVQKNADGHALNYVYDGWNLLEESKDDEVASYAYDSCLNSPFYMSSEKGEYYLHKDLLGSVVAISDEGGDLVSQYSYKPYGEFASQKGKFDSPFGFARGQYDSDTGLYYFRNRYYQPGLGRFISKDPLGYKNRFYSPSNGVPNGSRFESGDYVGMDIRRSFVPQRLFRSAPNDISLPEMNLYQYALGNPINFSDPSGLRVFLEADGNNINIGVTVETFGSAHDESMNGYIKDSIENSWSGQFGKYNITTNADVISRGDRVDYDRHRMEVREIGRSEIDCVGCSSMRIFLNNRHENGAIVRDYFLDTTIAHEIGHALGLSDRYYKSNSQPHPGWENNLMGCIGGDCSLDERNITEMLDAYNRGDLNKGLHRYRPSRYVNKRRREDQIQRVPDFMDYK